MIQICGEYIALPLKLLFETALKEKKFPDMWKLENVVPVHKKEEKSLLKSYRSSYELTSYLQQNI